MAICTVLYTWIRFPESRSLLADHIYYATSSRSGKLAASVTSSRSAKTRLRLPHYVLQGGMTSCEHAAYAFKHVKSLDTTWCFMLLQATFQVRLARAMPLC